MLVPGGNLLLLGADTPRTLNPSFWKEHGTRHKVTSYPPMLIEWHTLLKALPSLVVGNKVTLFHSNVSLVTRHHFITAHKPNLGQGNVFTPVYHSVHKACITCQHDRGSTGQGSLHPGGSASKGGLPPGGRRVCIREDLHPGGLDRPLPEHYGIRLTSGR